MNPLLSSLSVSAYLLRYNSIASYKKRRRALLSLFLKEVERRRRRRRRRGCHAMGV
jgi:hypothetical protein